MQDVYLVASAFNLGYHFLVVGVAGVVVVVVVVAGVVDVVAVVVVDVVVLLVVVVTTTGFRVVGLFVTGFRVTGIRVGRRVGTFTTVMGAFVGVGVVTGVLLLMLSSKKSSHST